MRTIWHLAHLADWAAARATGTYVQSTRDATLADVGFIHASYAPQLERVALAVYADDPSGPHLHVGDQ